MKCLREHMLKRINTQMLKHLTISLYTTSIAWTQPGFSDLCSLVSTAVGGLDELESKLSECGVPVTPSMIVNVLDYCKEEAPSRRLLRFFTWSRNSLGSALADKELNYAIRVFAGKKDHRAVDILLSDLRKDGGRLEAHTFTVVAETLVKVGREDDALGIFKNLDLFRCPQDETTVTAIVNALCAKGHAKRAEGVLYHHKDKVSGVESCVLKSILYGWSVQAKVKEARKTLQQIKSKKIDLDLYCFNTYLKCLCEHNLKKNPSGLVPEALNVFMEMKTYKIDPNSVSYNILLSCLGRTRRVKESVRIFDSMKKSGCCPDWVSYYLVIRVLYLSGRFGKGNQIMDMMTEEGIVPPAKFYYDLVGVLCGVERVNFALQLLDHMKKTSAVDCAPVYDVLIPKLCRSGDFEKGKELWDEAETLGVALRCSREVLDPSVTEVFHPTRKDKDPNLMDILNIDTRRRKPVKIMKKRRLGRKKRQKRKSKK